LFDRALISLNVPIALVQAGDDPSDPASGLAASSPDSAQFGDVRLGARVRLLGPVGRGLQLSLAAHLWLPTGASDSYVSDGAVRGSPFLIVGGNEDRLSWSAQAGMLFRPGKTLPGASETPVGTSFTFGAALGYLLDRERKLQVGPELYGQTVVVRGGSAFASKSTNAELILSGRYRLGDFQAALGAGPGIGSGAGTPDYRLLAAFIYSPEAQPTPTDRDGDGVPDAQDACPDQAGIASNDPRTNGCPAPASDADADGVPDSQDACPKVAGQRTSDAKTNGCPPDKDADGVADAADACPAEAGPPANDPKQNGCPLDSDGDGVRDDQDACPSIKGAKSDDPKRNGCPPDKDNDGIPDAEDACPDVPGVKQADPKHNGCRLARLIKEESLIAITQQVQFDHAKATIRPESDALLQDVAKVLREFPEIEQIEIGGHTDNTGPAYTNRKLSAERAAAVMKWLLDHGIEKKRLQSRGYGPDKPMADNKTDEGRAKNRRVEFRVTKGLNIGKGKK
jgi:outer membrane protein OmpA-like peptidoglycan-associated protein